MPRTWKPYMHPEFRQGRLQKAANENELSCRAIQKDGVARPSSSIGAWDLFMRRRADSGRSLAPLDAADGGPSLSSDTLNVRSRSAVVDSERS